MEMNRRLTFLMLFLVTLSQLRSEETPNLCELSILGEQWKVIEEARSKPLGRLHVSRIVFESGDGDLVSLQLQLVEGVSSPNFYKGGPWSEATISAFPGGHSESKEHMTSVSGSIQLTELTDKTPALAFTTYWRRDNKKNLISHGYSMAVGAFRVLLQHTSERVITPEFAEEVANLLIKQIGEPAGADQPATAPESKSEGNEKPKPESEERPQ